MEPAEFVVSMLLADLASVPMQDLGIPLLFGIVPILTIMALEILLSVVSYYSIGIRKLLCGRPVLLIDHGEILYGNLKKTRITPDELVENLREKNIFDLSIVQYAILETNGQISAMVNGNHKPPTVEECGMQSKDQALPVILVSSGKILEQDLVQGKHTAQWVQKELASKNIRLKDVILLIEESNGKIYLSVRKDVV